MQNLEEGGGGAGGQLRCIIGDVQVVNWSSRKFLPIYQ